MEVATTPSLVMSAEDIKPDLWYRRSAFAQFRFNRGRLLSDALLHDPSAPISVQNPRQPKQFFVLGSDVLAYLASYDALLDEGTLQKQRESDLANMKKRIENAEEFMRLAIKESDALALKKYENTLGEYRRDYEDKLSKFGDFRTSLMERVMEHLKMEAIDITKAASLSCGVYFLRYEGQIVYVGQSVSVYNRVSAHRKEKKFDQVSFLPCKQEELNNLEGFFIRLLMPKLNGHSRDGVHGAPSSNLWQEVVELDVRFMSK